MRNRNGTPRPGLSRLTTCTLTLLGLALTTPAAFGHVDDDKGHEHAPCDAKAVTQRVRTGSGMNTYESVPNWCQLPEGQQTLGPTHGGVVVDKAGNIYFSLDAGPNGILVYSPDGKLQKAIGKDLSGIHGLCINEEGGEEFIYAAHLKGKQIVKLKLDGSVVWSIAGAPKESGKYDDPNRYNPTAVAVGPDGSIYVVDGYGTQWVHQWDKNQKYVKSFGGPGDGPGQFNTCHGIVLDPRGPKPLLMICDRAHDRLQHFDLDGNFVAILAEKALRKPCTVSFHGDKVAIAELEGRVTILDGKNVPVAFLGDNPKRDQWANYGVPPEQWKPGIFTAPHGVSYDKDGNLYVMDWNASGRVSKLEMVKDQARAD
jgi:DNA-binding beta-propeller fold protein YncE